MSLCSWLRSYGQAMAAEEGKSVFFKDMASGRQAPCSSGCPHTHEYMGIKTELGRLKNFSKEGMQLERGGKEEPELEKS